MKTTALQDRTVQPFYFGPIERRLFGIVNPRVAGGGQLGIVLCPPFGQEAIRAQRLLRVLAERLARAGHDVLRFDYFGTGDSLGDDADADLDGWSNDLRRADAELRDRSACSRTVWIGMRVGGLVALRAAAQAPERLARLLLWDPPIDGGAYLRHLRERHVANLEQAFSLPPRPTFAAQAADPARFTDEALGFALPPRLREQLEALRPETLRWPHKPDSIVVLTDPRDMDGRALAPILAGAPGRVQAVEVSHGTDWTTDAADNSALVPANALARLVELSKLA